MAQTVVGIFKDPKDAQEAVDQLINNGFSRQNIDLSKRSSYTETETIEYENDEADEEGGRVSNFFRSLFGDSDEAASYTKAGMRGSVVTVHTLSLDEARRASDILDDQGSVEVSEDNQTTIMDADKVGNTDTSSIPIIEERIHVGKKNVETGKVRLRSRIIEQPVEENLRLRQERIYVNRNKVNRPASEADLANFKEGTMEFSETTEIPVVNKEARVVEEVTVGKNVSEREETIHETVRRTDVDVEEEETEKK